MTNHSRRLRVPVPLNRSEFKALEKYAAEANLPMSRVLLAIAERDIAEILRGRDPLEIRAGRVRQRKRSA